MSNINRLVMINCLYNEKNLILSANVILIERLPSI